MIKNLSKAIVKNYEGFNLREDLNFSDDGNYFRGFDYKGLPITTLRSNKDNTTYLSIRDDYLIYDNVFEFTREEWYATEESNLTWEFNGVSEFDIDELIDICEKILAKMNELNEKAKKDTDIDMSAVKVQIYDERSHLGVRLHNVKTNLEWWTLRDYDLKSARDYIKYLERDIERLNEIDNTINEMTRKEKKALVEQLEKYGYIKFNKEKPGYFLEKLENMIASKSRA